MAEKFNISQPSITRNMKKIEENFGVALFERGKNHISLNETGELAVECAKKVLQEAENAISKVQNFDKRQKTIVIEACAPAPLWSLLPELGKKYPDIDTALLYDKSGGLAGEIDGELQRNSNY